MLFFVGLHHVNHARRFTRCCISVNRLRERKSDFEVNDWIMDSGAFTQLKRAGHYDESPRAYAEQIARWKTCGDLLAAVTQDYMCEPFILEKTGLSVENHQYLTIERYDALVSEETGVYIMPVLQGYRPEEYARHVEMYGERLLDGDWVGVGSVCKRNAEPLSIIAILQAIRDVRGDLRLHGFGVKITAMRVDVIREWFYSADSMAWSFAARYQGRDANSWREALRYVEKIEEQPIQRSMWSMERALG